jgi:amidase
MNEQDYLAQDATGLADLIRRGQTTAAEVLEAAIAVCEKRNPVLNAVVYKAYDDARERVRHAVPQGPFTGVPFLIKDLGPHMAGMPRSRGSRYHAGEISPHDSELTRRFRQAGLVIFGKTNTPEFGITGTTEGAYLGPCRNPWNPDHIAGGSSGGASAAVASGIVPMAHASDGMGSIRIPAACCGLVGLKVTRSRNPDSGEDADRAIGHSVDHVLTRSVRDCAAMLDEIGYAEPDSPYAAPPKARAYMDEIAEPPAKLRVAFSTKTPNGRKIDAEVEAAVHATARLLADLGHRVEEASPDVDMRAFYSARGAFAAANMAAGIEARIAQGARPPARDDLEPLTWSIIEAGRKVSGVDAMRGWREFRVLSRRYLHFFMTYDVLLTPVMGTAPPPIGFIDPVRLEPKLVNERQADVFPFTPPANFTGQPAISLPLARSASGLPIGMMFAGRYGDEATLLALAAELERAVPWGASLPVAG